MSTKAYSSYTIIDVVDGLQWQGDSASDPQNPQMGWAYYNTIAKQSFLYDGEKWVMFAKDGSQGIGVSNVANYYYATQDTDETKLPTRGSSDWKTNPADLTNTFSETYKYLWNYEKVSYGNLSYSQTLPTIIGIYSKDGNGIQNIVEYYITTETNTPPSSLPTLTNTNGWIKDDGTTSLPQTSVEKPYLWNYEIIDYTIGTDTTSGPVCIGIYGNSIATTTEYYTATSTSSAPNRYSSGTTINTSIWKTSIAQIGQSETKPYVWNFERTEYTIDNPRDTEVVLLTSKPRVIDTITEYYTVKTDDSTPVSPSYTDTNHNTPPTIQTEWQPSQPIVSQGESLWNCEVIKYAAVDTSGKNLYEIVEASRIGYIGKDGADGDGSIPDKTTIWQYYLSTSNKEQTGGSWQDIMPDWDGNGYVWRRLKESWIQNDTFKTTYTAPELISNWEMVEIMAKEEGVEIGVWCAKNGVAVVENGMIAAGSIDADRLKVNKLSAITANMGELTAGSIESVDYDAGNTKILIWGNTQTVESEGLSYYENNNGTCTINGIGTCTDTDIIIPSLINGFIVTTISSGAFSNCDSLTSVKIGDNVTSIGMGAFSGCTSLTYIKIPDSVTSISAYAFMGCSSLTSIVIPDSVTFIGNNAFSGCSSLESITIPFVGSQKRTSSDTYQYPFGYIFGTSSYDGGVATLQYYYGSSTSSITSTTYYIPSSLKTVIVTSGEILCGAFYGCSNLTSVEIPDSVTSIGYRAFMRCSSLTSAIIGVSVTSIENEVFSWCSSLTSVEIPDSVTTIGARAFFDCGSLISVYYKGTASDWSKISIGDYNTGLTSATIYYYSKTEPTTEGNFWHYSSKQGFKISCSDEKMIDSPYFQVSQDGEIKAIEIELDYVPSEIKEESRISPYLVFTYKSKIGGYEVSLDVTNFNNNASESAIIIPSMYNDNTNGTKYVKQIAANGFDGAKCSNIILPDSLETIGDEAFAECSSLINMVIPDNVKTINNNVFIGCTNLQNVIIGEKVRTYSTEHSMFTDCRNLEKVKIMCNAVGASWFNECSTLKQVELGDGVTSIYEKAFCNCTGLESIIIPNSIKKIDSNAFAGCTALTKIYYQGNQYDWENSITIDSTNDTVFNNATIYCYDDKNATNGWYYTDTKGFQISCNDANYFIDSENFKVDRDSGKIIAKKADISGTITTNNFKIKSSILDSTNNFDVVIKGRDGGLFFESYVNGIKQDLKSPDTATLREREPGIYLDYYNYAVGSADTALNEEYALIINSGKNYGAMPGAWIISDAYSDNQLRGGWIIGDTNKHNNELKGTWKYNGVKIPKIEFGRAEVKTSSNLSSDNVDITLTFTSKFSEPPKVFTNLYQSTNMGSGSSFFVAIKSTITTQCVLNVRHTPDTACSIEWMAIGY